MVGGGDCKVATVEVEAASGGDNTATLPVTRPLNPQNSPPNAQDNAEKNNAANKEMELKNVRSTPAKKTSLFIIMSFIYSKLLVVVCIAYVISEVVTHKLPLYYYEGFFTYLYGMSILFLLYVFCFLLQESACCARGSDTPPPPPRPPKTGWAPKEPKDKNKKKDKKEKDQKQDKKKKEVTTQDTTDVEAGVATRVLRKRKTSQNDHSHGSFFLRIGAIAFGLGTMVYNGLEFGAFFEVPPTSPCYQILQGVNPVLQMIFTFMQMYFIFMNSRLNIHRFKVIARFGLMHVVATNLCVWIRTLVLESLKEITQYHKKLGQFQAGILGHTRVDCVGASKGLFFGLLLLVGSLICLILFFVLIHHPEFGLLAIYLADVSHCVLMALSIIAIIIGFIRVQSLKFKAEEQSDLNDILLRVSAFGLFVYAVFSVIAGSLAAFTHEPNLLVMVTGLLSVAQVVLQMLFIADVSRRRVHLPEHDRSKPGRQVVTFLLICNVTMWVIYTFETQKVIANPVQLDFYGFLAWAIVQRVTLPLCIFHRFHSAVTLAEIWKTSYKARLE
ncbi:Otopetrin-2 [Atta colombica]|uniref:Otopetrin-2 n=1 Tax=Atta colombica TaxID=520822 RepID=A0A195B9N1_9HYME|nr:Otopetrin-2 [Atta colombica]